MLMVDFIILVSIVIKIRSMLGNWEMRISKIVRLLGRQTSFMDLGLLG